MLLKKYVLPPVQTRTEANE
jgi:hypothetical protein